MMKVNRPELVANIRNYLELNKAIDFVGIGSMEVTRASSFISGNNSHLLPPEYIYTISPANSKLDFKFIKHYSNVSGHMMNDCLSNYQSFCKELAIALSGAGELTIDGLGNFYMLNKLVLFSPSMELMSKESYGLPVLNLVPIRSFQEKPDVTNDQIELKKVLKQTGTRHRIWNIVSTAAIFFLLVFAYNAFDAENIITEIIAGNFQVKQITNKGEIGAASMPSVDQYRINQKPALKLVNNSPELSMIPGNIDQSISSVSCALILGSFVSESNAAVLQQKILALSYDLYTEEIGNFIRVGVAYNCEDIKGETFTELEHSFGIEPELTAK